MSAGLNITVKCSNSGQYDLISFPSCAAISALPFKRSSRVIPSLRGAPPEDIMYLVPVNASFTSVEYVKFIPSKPQCAISSATPSKPSANGSYRQMFGVKRIMAAV